MILPGLRLGSRQGLPAFNTRINGLAGNELYRILHIIDSLGYGGTEHQLVLNISGVQGEKFENIVCYLHQPNDLERELAELGVPVYHLEVGSRLHWFKGVTNLKRLIRSLNVDLVHTNLYESDVIGGIAGRLAGRPVISTIANVCFEPEFMVDNPSLNWLKLESSRWMRLLVAHTCNTHLVSVSETVADSVQRRLKISAGKDSVIYRALSKSRLAPPNEEHIRRLRSELGLSDCSPVLINVGRLVPQKGQVYLLEAMGRVVEEFPRARLLMAGDGGLMPRLTELRDRLGLQEHVTFLGQRDDIKELLEMADLFVFPSLFEGCPNALIEAMARGKPCVASRIAPNSEVIDEGVTGVLAHPRSSQALADAIIKLASSDPDAVARMGEKARQASRERFTVRAAVEKLENLYQQVLDAHYGPRLVPSQVGVVD